MLPEHMSVTPRGVKVKIEFTDDSGAKYSFNIEGSSKENIGKLMDFANTISTQTSQENLIDTNFAKLYGLLESRFQFGLFTSNDALRAYQQDFQTNTTLSVVSTYLTRLTNRGLLTRTRHGSGWIYKLRRTDEQREQMIEQSTPIDLVSASQIQP